MDIKLSIIIPSYNSSLYIRNCIESLKTQTTSNVEYIFINDGSSDETLDFIQEFASVDRRVRYIDQENKGVSAARNAALDLAQGEFVLFLDSDDYLNQDSCVKILGYLEDNNVDCLIFKSFNIVHPDYVTVKQIGIKPGVYSAEDFVNRMFVLPISPKLYRMDIIRSFKLRFNEDLKLGEVFTFFVAFLVHSRFLGICDFSVYNYVIHGDNTILTIDYAKDLGVLKTIDVLRNYVRNSPVIAESFSYKRSLVKLIFSFTLTKYSKKLDSSPDAFVVINKCLEDEYICGVLRDLVFRDRSFYLERLVYTGLVFFPKFIFVLLNNIFRIKYFFN